MDYGWGMENPSTLVNVTWNAGEGKYDVTHSGVGNTAEGVGSETDCCPNGKDDPM